MSQMAWSMRCSTFPTTAVTNSSRGVLHAYKVSAADLGIFIRPGGYQDRDDDENQEDGDKE